MLKARRKCIDSESDYLKAVELAIESDPESPACPALEEAKRIFARTFRRAQKRFLTIAKAYARAILGGSWRRKRRPLHPTSERKRAA
jgi:hypothetical protein